jgi:hypothetical protein
MHIQQVRLEALLLLVHYRSMACQKFAFPDLCVSSSVALYIMCHSAVQGK